MTAALTALAVGASLALAGPALGLWRGSERFDEVLVGRGQAGMDVPVAYPNPGWTAAMPTPAPITPDVVAPNFAVQPRTLTFDADLAHYLFASATDLTNPQHDGRLVVPIEVKVHSDGNVGFRYTLDLNDSATGFFTSEYLKVRVWDPSVTGVGCDDADVAAAMTGIGFGHAVSPPVDPVLAGPNPKATSRDTHVYCVGFHYKPDPTDEIYYNYAEVSGVRTGGSQGLQFDWGQYDSSTAPPTPSPSQSPPKTTPQPWWVIVQGEPAVPPGVNDKITLTITPELFRPSPVSPP